MTILMFIFRNPILMLAMVFFHTHDILRIQADLRTRTMLDHQESRIKEIITKNNM